MEQLPIYINIAFGLIVLLTLLLFHKAANFSKTAIFLLTAWLVLQMVVALSGFYTFTDTTPPRVILLILPPILLIVALFFLKSGRMFIDSLNVRLLTLIHMLRVPVELILLVLYIHKFVPQEMTFEGRNFDVICGLTAPLIYYFGFIRKSISWKMLLIWNIVCLILLINIVSTAILSAPSPFQRFGIQQPNIAVLYFPFVWLPAFIVPVVLFSHLVSIRKLIRHKKGIYDKSS